MGLSVFASTALAVVFLFAAVSKLRDRDRFRSALMAHRWLPGNFVSPLAWLVPASELTCSFLIVNPSSRFIGAVCSIGLLLAFTGVLVADLARGDDVGCGCFGGGAEEKVSWMSIVRNCLLVALAGVVLSFPGSPRAPLAAILSGTALAFLLLLAEQAHAIFSRNWIGGRAPERG